MAATLSTCRAAPAVGVDDAVEGDSASNRRGNSRTRAVWDDLRVDPAALFEDAEDLDLLLRLGERQRNGPTRLRESLAPPRGAAGVAEERVNRKASGGAPSSADCYPTSGSPSSSGASAVETAPRRNCFKSRFEPGRPPQLTLR